MCSTSVPLVCPPHSAPPVHVPSAHCALGPARPWPSGASPTGQHAIGLVASVCTITLRSVRSLGVPVAPWLHLQPNCSCGHGIVPLVCPPPCPLSSMCPRLGVPSAWCVSILMITSAPPKPAHPRFEIRAPGWPCWPRRALCRCTCMQRQPCADLSPAHVKVLG